MNWGVFWAFIGIVIGSFLATAGAATLKDADDGMEAGIGAGAMLVGIVMVATVLGLAW